MDEILTSGSEDNSVTKGGANFLERFFTNSESLTISSINFIRHFTADNTTAALAWAKRGVIRSQMLIKEKLQWNDINTVYTQKSDHEITNIFSNFFINYQNYPTHKHKSNICILSHKKYIFSNIQNYNNTYRKMLYYFYSSIFSSIYLFICHLIISLFIYLCIYLIYQFSNTHLCASRSSFGLYWERASRMNTCPHSVHSFRAVNNLLIVDALSSIKGCPELLASLISVSEATAFATTSKIHKRLVRPMLMK